MINELKLQISSDELKELVSKRADYHQLKADKLEEEVKRLGEVLDDLDEEAEQLGKYTSNSNNPVDGLKSKVKIHRDRSTFFKFFAAHVVPNETYSLSHADLATIEVLGGRW